MLTSIRPMFALLFILLSSVAASAQLTGELPMSNGVRLSYSLTKTGEKGKSDQYVIVVTAQNTNPYALYYPVPMMKQTDGQYKLNSFEKKSFCDVTIENSTGLKSVVDKSANVAGEQTSLTTRKNEVLFKLAPGQTVTADFKFKVKDGNQPLITSRFVNPLKQLHETDVAINGLFINGTWEADCGGRRMQLSLERTGNGQVVLHQQLNGREQNWIMVKDNYFEKQGSASASVSYNQTGNVFTYANEDGVICIWQKK